MFDYDKYEGHTEGPLKVIEWNNMFWIVPENSDDVDDSIATIEIEGKAYPNGKLFRDAPLLLKRCRELEAMLEWQPIETAPKPSGCVLLLGTTKHAKWPHVGQGHWYKPGKKWEWHNYIGSRPNQPTHWMPLPQPLKDKENKELERN